MKQAGAALENLDTVVLQERHLPEGLACEMIRPAIVEWYGANAVGQTRFLAGPAQAQVTHEAARAALTSGHPVVGPDRQSAHARMSSAGSRGSGRLVSNDRGAPCVAAGPHDVPAQAADSRRQIG